MNHVKHALAAFGIAAVVAFPVGAATAAPPEIDHWEAVDSEPFLGCPGLNIQHSFDYEGSTRIVRHGKAGLQYFTTTFRGSNLFTNLETGRSLRLDRAGVDKDAKIVDNGDGTLTIIVLATGSEKLYANGRLLFSNNGQIRFEVLVDHNGTPTDYTDDADGVFIRIVKPSTGTNGGDGRNFCADLQQFTS